MSIRNYNLTQSRPTEMETTPSRKIVYVLGDFQMCKQKVLKYLISGNAISQTNEDQITNDENFRYPHFKKGQLIGYQALSEQKYQDSRRKNKSLESLSQVHIETNDLMQKQNPQYSLDSDDSIQHVPRSTQKVQSSPSQNSMSWEKIELNEEQLGIFVTHLKSFKTGKLLSHRSLLSTSPSSLQIYSFPSQPHLRQYLDVYFQTLPKPDFIIYCKARQASDKDLKSWIQLLEDGVLNKMESKKQETFEADKKNNVRNQTKLKFEVVYQQSTPAMLFVSDAVMISEKREHIKKLKTLFKSQSVNIVNHVYFPVILKQNLREDISDSLSKKLEQKRQLRQIIVSSNVQETKGSHSESTLGIDIQKSYIRQVNLWNRWANPWKKCRGCCKFASEWTACKKNSFLLVIYTDRWWNWASLKKLLYDSYDKKDREEDSIV